MWTVSFWKDAIERAIKSAAQAVLLAVGGEAFNVWTMDWATVSGIGLGGAGLSLLTSLGSEVLPFGNKGTASLTKAVEPAAGPS